MKFIIKISASILFTMIVSFVKANIVNTDTLIVHIVQNDTTICKGSPVHLSVSMPASGNIILPPASLFEYIFNSPPVGWTITTGGWTTGNAPFGNEIDTTNNLPPEFNYHTYWPATVNSDPSYLFVRRNIDLSGYDLSTINWHLGVDNGFTLYINGNRVDSEWDEGYTYRWEYEGIFPAAFLHSGNNVIAAALEDNGGLTAFDMMIDSPVPVPGLFILWSTGDTTASINVTPQQTTTYYVTVSNGTETCTDSVKVAVNQPSSQMINASICQGQTYSGYTNSGTYIDTLVAKNGCDSLRTINLIVKPRSFLNITQSICDGQTYLGYSTSGTYVNTFVAANGCDSVRILKLTVLPPLRPYLGADTILCSGDSLTLYPGQFNTYTWQNGSTQNRFIAKQSGLYSVIVTNNCGTANDDILIRGIICDIYFPSAFTPNNDGKNDLFKILNAYNLSDFYLSVYNRWGQKVFETKDYTNGWNGVFKSKVQPSDVFVWYCEFRKPGNPNKLKMQGTILLIR